MEDNWPPEIYIPAIIIVWTVLIIVWIKEARQRRKALSEQDQSHREDGRQDGLG
jgi:hypothetical protein